MSEQRDGDGQPRGLFSSDGDWIAAAFVGVSVFHLPSWVLSLFVPLSWPVVAFHVAVRALLIALILRGYAWAKLVAVVLMVVPAVFLLQSPSELGVPGFLIVSAALLMTFAQALVAGGRVRPWQRTIAMAAALLGLLPNSLLIEHASVLAVPSASTALADELPVRCRESLQRLRVATTAPVVRPLPVPPGARDFATRMAQISNDSEFASLLGETLAKALFPCEPANRNLQEYMATTPGPQRQEDRVAEVIADGIELCHCQRVDVDALVYVFQSFAPSSQTPRPPAP